MRRRCSSRNSGSELEEPIVNLTPLIDVVFVVLIMFIVIAPLLELDEVQLASATPQVQKEVARLEGEYPVKLYVKEDNSIWFNNSLMTPDSLGMVLEDAKVKYPATTPLVFHDGRATFATYQAVKGAVERAGFEKMDIVLKPGG